MTDTEESHAASLVDVIEKRMQDNARLREENRRLREALKPFADVAFRVDGDPEWFGNGRRPDHDCYPLYLSMREYRAARLALAQQP